MLCPVPCVLSLPARAGCERGTLATSGHHDGSYAACPVEGVVMVAADRWPIEADFDMQAVEPWDRQPDEPSKAYAAFRLFRDLTPSQRANVAAIAERAGVSERLCRQYAAEWQWRERADAWDDVCHRLEDAERLDAIRQMHAVHRRAGRVALTKAVAALNILSPENMTASQIARMLELGAKLERSTLIVSVEELQGLDIEEDEDEDDPWERIARALAPDDDGVADL